MILTVPSPKNGTWHEPDISASGQTPQLQRLGPSSLGVPNFPVKACRRSSKDSRLSGSPPRSRVEVDRFVDSCCVVVGVFVVVFLVCLCWFFVVPVLV